MISTKIIQLDLSDPWTISRNSSVCKKNVFIKIKKDGVVGFGEAAPNIRYGETPELTQKQIHQVSDIILKEDFHSYSHVKELLDNLIICQNCAKAALDIAIMDWVSRSKKIPLYEIVGSNPDKTPLTSYSIGIDEADMIKRKVSKTSDYGVLKIKLGTDNDKDIIDAVRSATGKPIRVDANEGWTDKEVALKKIKWLESIGGVEFIEQPMPAEMLEETSWLRDRVELPLIVDEAVIDAKDISSIAEVYDGINIKLMKSGGIQEALKMINAGRAAGLKIMIGCMIESSLAITAASHLSPLADWADLDGNLLISNDPFSGVKIADGRLVLGAQPGIAETSI